MRQVIVYNHAFDPPRLVGHAVLHGERIELHDFPAAIRIQLENGILDWRTKERLTVDDGESFLEAMLTEFSGSYIRAEADSEQL